MAREAIRLPQEEVDAFGNVIGDSLARSSTSGNAAPQAQGSSGSYDDEYRSQNIASMLQSANRAAGGDDSYDAASAGMTAWPMVASGQGGYLPSMFPEPQIVASNLNGPVPTYLYDTNALASGVLLHSAEGTALPPGPSLAAAPDPTSLDGMRASGNSYYSGMVASDNAVTSGLGRLGRGLSNAGYDFVSSISKLPTLFTDADVRARAILNGVSAIQNGVMAAAHPIDTATGLYAAGTSYLQNNSVGQIFEDSTRLAGGFALSTAGGKGFSLIGDVAEGTVATDRLASGISSAEGLIADGANRVEPLALRDSAELGEAGGILDESRAPATGLAPNVKGYPDGSLRTPDGKFASVVGQPAPGTVNASNYADFLRSNGIDVVGTELEVDGPLGVRRYDIGTRNPDGTLFGIEIKSGGAMPGAYQEFSDRYINQFGAVGRGRIAGQSVTGSMTIYLPSGGF